MLCFFCDPYISSSRFKLIISNLLHVNYKELVMIIKEVKLMAGINFRQKEWGAESGGKVCQTTSNQRLTMTKIMWEEYSECGKINTSVFS